MILFGTWALDLLLSLFLLLLLLLLLLSLLLLSRARLFHRKLSHKDPPTAHRHKDLNREPQDTTPGDRFIFIFPFSFWSEFSSRLLRVPSSRVNDLGTGWTLSLIMICSVTGKITWNFAIYNSKDTKEPLFRGHPRDQAKGPPNRGVSRMEVGLGFVNNSDQRIKYLNLLFCLKEKLDEFIHLNNIHPTINSPANTQQPLLRSQM